TVDGISDFDSTKVDETQLEQNYFGVVSLFKTLGDASLQAAVFARYSTMLFRPDRLADVMFNGTAQRVTRSSIAPGLQLDGTYVLTPTHTLHAGAYLAAEQTSVQSTSDVLPAVDGVQTHDQPFTIFASRGKIGYTYSVYLQDAWRIRPSVTINGGVRLDGIAAFTNEYQFSPRLNVVWEATPTTTVHRGCDGRNQQSGAGGARPLRRRRHHPADLPGCARRPRRLLQEFALPPGRGTVRGADILDPVQLPSREQRGDRADRVRRAGELQRLRQSGCRAAVGQGHRDRAGALLARGPGVHPRPL